MNINISEEMKKEYKKMALYAIGLFVLLGIMGSIVTDAKTSLGQSALASFGFISLFFMAKRVKEFLYKTDRRKSEFITAETFPIALAVSLIIIKLWECIFSTKLNSVPDMLLICSGIGIVAMAVDIALSIQTKHEMKNET